MYQEHENSIVWEDDQGRIQSGTIVDEEVRHYRVMYPRPNFIEKTSVIYRGTSQAANSLARRLAALEIQKAHASRKIERRFKVQKRELLDRFQ